MRWHWFCTLVLIVALTGCGKSGPDTKAPDAKAPAEPVTIKLKTQPDVGKTVKCTEVHEEQEHGQGGWQGR